MTKHTRHSALHCLFRYLEWRESFLISIFCSYDDLPDIHFALSLSISRMAWEFSDLHIPQLWRFTRHSLCNVSFDISNGVRVSWSPYSAVMPIYPPWYVKRCFITEYSSPKAIFISFDVWQNVFGKLETAGFTVRPQGLHNLYFVRLEVMAVMNIPPNSRLRYTQLQSSSSSLKIIGHGNTDNNLESHCKCILIFFQTKSIYFRGLHDMRYVLLLNENMSIWRRSNMEG
jgi:hypothetical protein